MADKISTIVLKIDLECARCYKKIRRVLCKIQDKLDIKTISYDEKSNAVTISGPFDADKVCKKLCCEAGRVIKEMNIKGKEESKDKDGGGDKTKAAKPAEKDAGKPEKAKEGKADKEAAEPEKKEAKAEKKEAKEEKELKPEKEKKVKFEFDDAAPAADAKPGNAMPMPAGMSKADLGPLLEKMMASKPGPEPPRGEPIAPPMTMVPPAPAAQGVAVPSIWPAPAGSVYGYSYNPGYEPSSYYGGGYGCGCGGYKYCRCGKPAAPGGYYGGPVYDNQGWYYHQQQQQPCCEDPNAECSVM
ncbi:protein PYRICULARIA ORYZAE RESISTANCE 21-like [Phragmites australis]|uniref:protein PYRICULARIA ORYZAE RESISTANCE 21-like n=1 Tax=Phragmites australis TaxID=29695 RepID=UPI002D79D250|nr:protein PYRICULARIA ORYZAE RESISTANCE 21-like [Phragmites australis]